MKKTTATLHETNSELNYLLKNRPFNPEGKKDRLKRYPFLRGELLVSGRVCFFSIFLVEDGDNC